MTSDPWVLSVVRFGYRLEFTATPPRSSAVRVTEIPQETVKREALLEELRELLAKNAIVQVQGPSLPGFFSTFFLTPKRSGAWRPILNLKPLNAFMRPPPFRMETLKAILLALHPGSWGFH